MPSKPPWPSTPQSVRDLGRVVERRLDDAAVGAALGREEQALRERIPGRAVDLGHRRLAVGLGLGELRHAVRRVGVEVDARDVVAVGRIELVALVEEVRAVVVLRVGAVLALDDEVGVLVRLALRRLDVVPVACTSPGAGSIGPSLKYPYQLVRADGFSSAVEPCATVVSRHCGESLSGSVMPAVLVLAEPASVSAGPFANVVAPSTATAPSAATTPAIRSLRTDTCVPSRVWTRGTGQAARPRSVDVTVGMRRCRIGRRSGENLVTELVNPPRRYPAPVPALAVHSFLGQVARPHYEAVASAVAAQTGVTFEPLRETPLARLPAVVAGPPALLFVCGLPYTRMRDAGAPDRAARRARAGG